MRPAGGVQRGAEAGLEGSATMAPALLSVLALAAPAATLASKPCGPNPGGQRVAETQSAAMIMIMSAEQQAIAEPPKTPPTGAVCFVVAGVDFTGGSTAAG